MSLYACFMHVASVQGALNAFYVMATICVMQFCDKRDVQKNGRVRRVVTR